MLIFDSSLNCSSMHRSDQGGDEPPIDHSDKQAAGGGGSAPPNVSLASVLDISHQRDVESEKIQLGAKKPAATALEEAKVATGKDVKLTAVKVSKRKKWKKPKDKPKRPLSAYNLFFQHERERLLYGPASPEEIAKAQAPAEPLKEGETPQRNDGKIGFAALAKEVAGKWRALGPPQRERFEKEAAKEKERYRIELEEWKKNQVRREQEAQEWTARREGVIRSLSGIVSEQERADRAERALQAAVSMQPAGFGNAGGLSQRYLDRSYDDALVNHLQSQRLTQQYDQLANESLIRQRLMNQETPMDFYTRMIYSGTADVSAANAMHSYLSAQFVAAGRSLGVTGEALSSIGGQPLPGSGALLGDVGQIPAARSLSLPAAASLSEMGQLNPARLSEGFTMPPGRLSEGASLYASRLAADGMLPESFGVPPQMGFGVVDTMQESRDVAQAFHYQQQQLEQQQQQLEQQQQQQQQQQRQQQQQQQQQGSQQQQQQGSQYKDGEDDDYYNMVSNSRRGSDEYPRRSI